jgi:ceramide synthetase
LLLQYIHAYYSPFISLYSQGLARRLIFGKGYDKLAETEERRKRINKFKESAWKFVYFSSAEVLSLSVTYNEPWFTNTRYFWVGPGEQLWPDQKMK